MSPKEEWEDSQGLPLGLPQGGFEHWAVLVVVCAGALAVILVGIFLDADPAGHGTHTQLGLPECSTIRLYDVPCPGCGVTTSAALLVQGHPWAAFINQPFGCLLALALPILAFCAVREQLAGRNLARWLIWIDMRRGMALVLLIGISWAWKIYLHRSAS